VHGLAFDPLKYSDNYYLSALLCKAVSMPEQKVNQTSKLIFIVLALLISCSPSREKKTSDSPDQKEQMDQARDVCSDLISIGPEKDFNIFRNEPVRISPDHIKEKDRYQKLEKAFYDRYLAGSDMVHDWINGSDHPPDLQTSHFFWGALQLDNDMCQFIIYEHFSYNGSEDKLILLNLGEDGEPIGSRIIAGRISSPGADIQYSSKIWEDRFHVFRTAKGAIDHKADKFKYQKDSVVSRYKLTGHQIELTGKDSLSETYWE